MKQLRKITVNSNEYLFINESRNTRHGFAHDTILYKNDVFIGETTAHYLNRTWESYRYQTVMKCCVDEIIKDKLDRFIANFKAKNGICRLTKAKREEVETAFYNREDIKELQQVRTELNEYR
jgi:hypothetical protein